MRFQSVFTLLVVYEKPTNTLRLLAHFVEKSNNIAITVLKNLMFYR